MHLTDIGRDLCFIIGSFFIGAIPFCFILGKIAGRKNLKEIGDKNPGGWNLIFNVSKIWGITGLLLDMAKGFFPYYLALKFTYGGNTGFLNINHNELIAVISACAAIAGHSYSPFLKWNGGKGLAAWIGFIEAASWFSLPVAGAGFLAGIFIARNMIWAVSLGIVFTGVFLWLYKNSFIFLFSIIILILIMIPRQINSNLTLGKNFQFRREATVQDLFRPRIR